MGSYINIPYVMETVISDMTCYDQRALNYLIEIVGEENAQYICANLKLSAQILMMEDGFHQLHENIKDNLIAEAMQKVINVLHKAKKLPTTGKRGKLTIGYYLGYSKFLNDDYDDYDTSSTPELCFYLKEEHK